MKQPTFYEVLTAAVNDMAEHGFDSVERLAGWIARIRAAAEATLTPVHVLEAALQSTFGQAYKTYVDNGKVLERHPGVPKFTLDRVKPKLRAALDRATFASADLIKLNRQASIEKTVQRFSGWASSIPPGGTDATEKVKTKTEIRKALASLPFEERRVLTDQGHKFVANLNNIIAVDGGAIGAEWHSHWRQTNYNYRVDHKERDGKFYVIRDSWAHEKGLLKSGDYLDEITQPGEEVFCRCWCTYIYALRSMPAELISAKGKAELMRVKLALMG